MTAVREVFAYVPTVKWSDGCCNIAVCPLWCFPLRSLRVILVAFAFRRVIHRRSQEGSWLTKYVGFVPCCLRSLNGRQFLKLQTVLLTFSALSYQNGQNNTPEYYILRSTWSIIYSSMYIYIYSYGPFSLSRSQKARHLTSRQTSAYSRRAPWHRTSCHFSRLMAQRGQSTVTCFVRRSRFPPMSQRGPLLLFVPLSPFPRGLPNEL